MSDALLDLTRPFAARYVKDDGRGNSYVPHHTIIQRIILATGAPPEIQIVREVYDGDVLSGVLMRMTVQGFEPVEEFGESDNPQSKTNGARAKDAASDAVKRAAMRLGCGLHLWSGNEFFLYDQLVKRSQEAGSDSQGTARAAQSEGEASGSAPEPSKLPVEEPLL